MAANQNTLLSVDDFARHVHRDPHDVLRQLHQGEIAGQLIDNTWYVNANALHQTEQVSQQVSAATTVMLAAANMHWREIFDAFHARRSMPLKASTPEFGLDIGMVEAEVMRAKRKAFWFDLVIGIAALYGLAILVGMLTGQQADLVVPDDSGAVSAEGKLFLAWAVIAVADFIYHRNALARARALLAHPPLAADANSIDQDSDRNVTVSGGYAPFVGSGIDIGGWSFTVNLGEPDTEGGQAEPVTVTDLYDETRQALRKLSIPTMAVRDEIFVDGRDVRGVDILLPEGPFACPVERINPDIIAHRIGDNDNVLRHYKVIRLQLWNGQMILSTMFRYVILTDTLFVEAKTRLLTPVKEKFLKMQNLPLISVPWERLADAFSSAVRALVIWIPVLLRGIAFIQGQFLLTKKRRLKINVKEIQSNWKYNYGWSTSLRETWASENYSRYFQMIDQDFYSKMVKESLLDSLLKSLERRHISTESLKSASTKIYNEGVIINGGAVRADSIAAGKGAQATVQNFVRGAQNSVKA